MLEQMIKLLEIKLDHERGLAALYALKDNKIETQKHVYAAGLILELKKTMEQLI